LEKTEVDHDQKLMNRTITVKNKHGVFNKMPIKKMVVIE
jgi:hypothetical protein